MSKPSYHRMTYIFHITHTHTHRQKQDSLQVSFTFTIDPFAFWKAFPTFTQPAQYTDNCIAPKLEKEQQPEEEEEGAAATLPHAIILSYSNECLMCLWIVVFMALRIVRLFWWHAKQFVYPLTHTPCPTLFPSLSLFILSPSVALFYYQKFDTLKNIQRQKTEPTEYNNESTVWRWPKRTKCSKSTKREREQRTALPTPKEFRAAGASCCFGSARLALLLLLLMKFKDGNSGCCCLVLLSTSRRLDAYSAGVSLAHSLTLVNNYAVCVAAYACVRTSLAVACVRPADAARNFKFGNIHKVKAKVIPLLTTDKSTNWQWPI